WVCTSSCWAHWSSFAGCGLFSSTPMCDCPWGPFATSLAHPSSTIGTMHVFGAQSTTLQIWPRTSTSCLARTIGPKSVKRLIHWVSSIHGRGDTLHNSCAPSGSDLHAGGHWTVLELNAKNLFLAVWRANLNC